MKFSSAGGSGDAENMTQSTGEEMYCMHCAHCQERESLAQGSHNRIEQSLKSEGMASERTGRKEVNERVRGLSEDKETIPVFRRTNKGLKHMYNK